MQTLSFDINNQRTIELIQRRHDGQVLIRITDGADHLQPIPDNEAFISAGEIVMLINYFRNCKSGIEQSDYIK